MAKLGDLEERAWAGFLRTHERLWRALEAGLSTLDVSMAEYDVLAALEAAGDGGIRMSDLAERRLMSSGGSPGSRTGWSGVGCSNDGGRVPTGSAARCVRDPLLVADGLTSIRAEPLIHRGESPTAGP